MKKVRLKESDLLKIVNRVILEQGLPPFPEKTIDPTRASNGAGTPTEILIAKKKVFESLNSAISSIRTLIQLSGVNPDNNNIVDDIEKVKEKFNNLFGASKPKEEKEPV
jgi:hypothetical protein